MSLNRIIVVGGGMSGLAAAYRLQSSAVRKYPPSEIQLLEASDRLGGIVQTKHQDGFVLENGPDCFLSEKPATLNLCEELGLGGQLINTRFENRRSFIVRGGKLHPIPKGFYLIAPAKLRPFLGSPLLSWPGKWRVLWESLLPAHAKEDESLADFVRRRFGQENLDWMAQPLLAGIYAADPEALSLRATFPQFVEMEEKFGSVLVGLKKRDEATQQASGARYSLFTALRDGMQTLTDQLKQQLTSVRIRTNTAVKALERRNDSWSVELANGEHVETDGVCLALPAHQAAKLLQRADPILAGLLEEIPYSSSATLNFAFKEGDIAHPLDGFGFVTPSKERRTTLACTFVHRKFPGRAPLGMALLRAFVGGALQEELLQLDDQELERRVLADLKDLLGVRSAPIFCTITRWPRAMPQYTLGHIQRILKIEEAVLRLPGLQLAGNWLRGVGLPDCIDSANRAATRLLESAPAHQSA